MYYFNWFIFPQLFTILRNVSDTIIYENNRCSDSYSNDSFVYTHNNSPKGSEPIRELSTRRIYFRRGLTFFIEQYQRKQDKVRNRPNLSIRYEPESYPDTYSPEATIYLDPRYDPRGNRTQEYLQRKFLKIAVENNGGAVAEDCKATLRTLNFNPTNTRHPSKEPKTLLWDTDEIIMDIGIGGFAMLYIVLSDSRLSTEVFQNILRENYRGLVASPATFRVKDNPYVVISQDAFGIGDFDVEIAIYPKSGEIITAVFRIHVTDDWHQISMERIS